MRLLSRRRDVRDEREGVTHDDVRDDDVRDRDMRGRPVRDEVTRDEVVDEPEAYPREEIVRYKWSPAIVLAVLAGAALAALGIVVLIRTQINDTWYTPVETVARIDHTPLLGAIEVGVGALLVILGLLGLRRLTAFVCIAGAVAAAVAAIDPTRFSTELAIERWWAIALAAGGATLAILLMLPPPVEAVAPPPSARRRRGYRHRVVQQH
ncbi:MAG TPA: hypothetical protein VKD21_08440 [Acidimicrobiales bacterium]|nr:hypothetical protein [Acidimicrobiales bacterium]